MERHDYSRPEGIWYIKEFIFNCVYKGHHCKMIEINNRKIIVTKAGDGQENDENQFLSCKYISFPEAM